MNNHYNCVFVDSGKVDNFSSNSSGLNTPCSVIMPVINEAGVTSNAGFQT